MVRFEAWLIELFLALMWALPFWMSPVTSNLCTPLKTLKDELNATLRRRFLKYNFPINYTIQVRYEEVFRLRNISRLNDTVDVRDLQDVWVKVTKTGIKKILAVLPEKHPTRHKYLKNLDGLFSSFLESYQMQKSERDIPDVIEDIFVRLDDPYYQGGKSVTPKSLLDSCYRTMHCLFKDCFLINGDEDYCISQHWRKGKGTQG